MLTVNDTREAIDDVYKAMDYFRNHDTVYDVSVKAEHDLRDALSCFYKICRQIYEQDLKQLRFLFTE
jgi:hypothetical protein